MVRAAGGSQLSLPTAEKPRHRHAATVEIVRTGPHINYARSADGVSLAFTIAGNGPALVFVPWVPFSNLRMEWQNPMLHRVFELLSQRLTVIHYDGPGTGHEDPALHGPGPGCRARRDQGGAEGPRRAGRHARSWPA